MLTKLLDLQYRYSLSTSQVSSVIDGKEKCWVTLNRKLILLASENNTAKEKFKKLLSYSYTTTQQFWLHPLSMLFRWELFQFPLLGKRGNIFQSDVAYRAEGTDGGGAVCGERDPPSPSCLQAVWITVEMQRGAVTQPGDIWGQWGAVFYINNKYTV